MTQATNSSDRLDRIEQLLNNTATLLASTADQTVANIGSIGSLTQLMSETRSDMAHMTDWAEQVTEAVTGIRAIQQSVAATQQSLAAGQERHEAILMRMDARIARQDEILERLDMLIENIVRRPEQGGSGA